MDLDRTQGHTATPAEVLQRRFPFHLVAAEDVIKRRVTPCDQNGRLVSPRTALEPDILLMGLMGLECLDIYGKSNSTMQLYTMFPPNSAFLERASRSFSSSSRSLFENSSGHLSLV